MEDYTYAVARIRCRESKLLGDSDLKQLLASKDADTVLRLLRDKGWGDGTDASSDAVLKAEEEKLWAFIDEIVPDRNNFAFLLAPNDFHNLKAAVKAITRDIPAEDYFIRNSLFDADELYAALRKREYEALPEYLRDTAKIAMMTLLETSDGQLCDIIIDKACMEHVYTLGKAADNEIIRLYCELFVASADIKLAVRCAKTNKKHDFILRSMAPCDTLDIKRLASAASLGYDDIISYLGDTDYRAAVDHISTSMSAFEKWCDDNITEAMKSQKWEPFTIGPVVAYIIARENEIKAVRMILSAKINGLDEEIINERLRMMYA